MVQGIDNVLKLFREADLPYWRLYEGWEMKPNNLIAESKGSESQTDRTSTEANLNDILQMQQAGKYLLSVRKAFNSTSQQGVNIKFDIPFANGMMAGMARIGNTNTQPIGYVHKSEMELELVKQRHDFEMKEFSRKLDEIQKKKEPKEDALGKFLTNYGPVIMGVLAQKFGIAPAGAQVGLAGFDNIQQPAQQQATDNLQAATGPTPDQKMEWVINTLAQKEGSHEAAADLLYKFTHFILQNPAQYDAFKPMILNTKIETTNG